MALQSLAFAPIRHVSNQLYSPKQLNGPHLENPRIGSHFSDISWRFPPRFETRLGVLARYRRVVDPRAEDFHGNLNAMTGSVGRAWRDYCGMAAGGAIGTLSRLGLSDSQHVPWSDLAATLVVTTVAFTVVACLQSSTAPWRFAVLGWAGAWSSLSAYAAAGVHAFPIPALGYLVATPLCAIAGLTAGTLLRWKATRRRTVSDGVSR
jgi:fluoride ion exporter CrcB/FEX